jgi:hypothetical protein
MSEPKREYYLDLKDDSYPEIKRINPDYNLSWHDSELFTLDEAKARIYATADFHIEHWKTIKREAKRGLRMFKVKGDK